MFIAYIMNHNDECIAQIEDLVGIEIDHQMSDSSSAVISIFHDNPWATKAILKKMNKILITQIVGEEEKIMFKWIIRGLQIDLSTIKVICNDEIWKLGKRITHNAYEYRNEQLEVVLRRIWNDINAVYPIGLDFECHAPERIPKKSYGKKTTLLSILKDWKEKGYEFRLFDNVLVFGKQVGRDRTQGELYKEYFYDTETPDSNTILSAKMFDDAKDVTNGIMDENYNSRRQEESIQHYGFLEEGVSLEGKSSAEYLEETKNGSQIYEVEWRVDNFYEVEIGDFVRVSIHRNNDLMNFDGVMQVVQKKYSGWDLPRISYKFSTERVIEKDFIGKIKKIEEELHKIKLWWWSIQSTAPSPTVDLSWYATSSAVNQALQAQNSKIDQKADSTFVQWVAQAAQTALNTANQKAPLQHTHTKNEVWLWAVDNTSDEDKPLSRATREVLALKANLADIVDSLESEDAAKPLSARQGKILKGFIDQVLLVLASDDTTLDSFREIVAYIKQNKRILSQLGISNIAGLVEALEGKADKEHTHTVGQITDFPSSLPASDVPAWAKKATKPAYTWDEIQEKPEVFPSSDKFIEVNVDTAYNAVAKIGTTTSWNYTPQKWDVLLVNFVNGTQAAAPTLNIDWNGAKNIRSGYYNVGTNMLQLWRATNSNIKVMLRYDGQYYQMFGAGHNNTYWEIPEAEINNATLATARLLSGRRIAKMKEYFEQNVPTPSAPNHSANKQYVDGLISGINTTLQSLGQTSQVILTKAQWKALSPKDPNTIYFVKGVWVYVGNEKIIANDTPWFKMLH